MKKYEIQVTGRTLTLTINKWQKYGKNRLYLNLVGSYGNYGDIAFIENGVVTPVNKEWERIERKAPEVMAQIKAAIAAYEEGLK